MRSWKILDRGGVPEVSANTIEYTCIHCNEDALMPVKGRPLAQIEMGIVFDVGDHAMPREIECPNCHRQFELCERPKVGKG